MSEDRKIFPIEAALHVIAKKPSDVATEFLSFAVQRPVCEKSCAVVSPMVRGWLFCLQPEFAQMAPAPEQGFGIWVDDQKKRFGDNISIPPMEAAELAELNSLLDSIAAMKEGLAEKDTVIADLKGKLAAAEPFKGKAEKLEKDKAALEEKNAAFKEEVGKLKSELSAFSGKVAINEADLEQSVKDLVSRAVKDALAALPVAAATAAAAGEAGAAAGEAAVEETSAPIDDFGFGNSGSNSDGFGF